MDISQPTPTTDRTYTTDDVNRYTAATDPAETFSYGTNDIDGNPVTRDAGQETGLARCGNMTGDNTLSYAWDAGTLDISGLATRAVADACPPEKSGRTG